MEYLLVHFDEDRGVIINDAPGAWMTNQKLILQAGTYYIELAPPLDYAPPQIPVQLVDTTVDQPYEIFFTKTT
ncbi:MAG: hypothetical protein ACREQH_13505 [Candidatus Binatus sp.]